PAKAIDPRVAAGRPATHSAVPTSSVTPAPPLLSRASARDPATRKARASSHTARLDYAVLGLIVLAGALLRLQYLHAPTRWDESATFQEYARGSLGTIVSTYN